MWKANIIICIFFFWKEKEMSSAAVRSADRTAADDIFFQS